MIELSDNQKHFLIASIFEYFNEKMYWNILMRKCIGDFPSSFKIFDLLTPFYVLTSAAAAE